LFLQGTLRVGWRLAAWKILHANETQWNSSASVSTPAQI
jgi:hypothetical protein